MLGRDEGTRKDIIGERGLRYKRNVLAISLVVTILWLTAAHLEDVSLFGVKLPPNEMAEATAWAVVTAILLYQWILLFYYGWSDWIVWRDDIQGDVRLSISAIYRGVKLGQFFHVGDHRGWAEFEAVTQLDSGVNWVARFVEGERKTFGSGLQTQQRKDARARLNAFVVLEFGGPAVWGLASLLIVGGQQGLGGVVATSSTASPGR